MLAGDIPSWQPWNPPEDGRLTRQQVICIKGSALSRVCLCSHVPCFFDISGSLVLVGVKSVR